MEKIGKEIVFDIRKNPFLFLIMAIQLTVYFLVGFFSGQLEKEIDFQGKDIGQDRQETKYYRIIDNLVGQYEEDFFRDSDALGKLKIMYAQLINNDNFEYLEMYDNPIVLIGENIKDELLYRYEYGEGDGHRGIENGEIYNEIKCFWMSCNVGDIFDIQCQKGSLWKEETKNETPTPIVLGSDYLGIFEVGDMIDGLSPVDEDARFQVYGILDEGEYVVHRGKVLNLDRYVLIPLQDAKNLAATKEEIGSHRILYLFKINGALRSDLPANELQDIIQEICDSSGVTPASSVVGATNMQSYILNVSLGDILALFKEMLVMLNVFSSIATLLYLSIRIDKNREYLSILVLNGFSVKQIMGILLGTLALLLLISETIAAALFYFIAFLIWKGAEISIAGIVVYNLAILSAAMAVSFIKLKKLDIGYYIGGGI